MLCFLMPNLPTHEKLSLAPKDSELSIFGCTTCVSNHWCRIQLYILSRSVEDTDYFWLDLDLTFVNVRIGT
jgi:hypothetical protein